jgi:ribosome maturation factor RimP
MFGAEGAPFYFALLPGVTLELRAHLEELLDRELEQLGYELVKLDISLRGRRKIIRIFIDHHERDVTLDNCVEVTKAVGFVLDGEDIMIGPYNLEVSSPGINRPLTKREHFERFRGKIARIEHRTGNGEKDTAIGELAGCEGDAVMVRRGDVETRIGFDTIVKANLHGEKWDIGKKKQRGKRERG